MRLTQKSFSFIILFAMRCIDRNQGDAKWSYRAYVSLYYIRPKAASDSYFLFPTTASGYMRLWGLRTFPLK